MTRLATVIAVALLVAGAAYALNKGLFVGSQVYQAQGTGGVYWYRGCSYLFPSGVAKRQVGGWLTREEAENEVCTLFLLD